MVIETSTFSYEDIVNGNVKVILSVVWRMIVSFQVTNDTNSQPQAQEKSALALRKEAKSKLLLWVKDKTNIDVKDCDVRYVHEESIIKIKKKQ
jgi:hypothetical protein